jgi:DNA-binding phage protein
MAERKTTRPRGTVSPADELQLGSHSRIFNDEDVLLLLRAAVEREGNQGAFARRHGLERTYLNQVLKRRKPVSGTILKALGLRKVYAPE